MKHRCNSKFSLKMCYLHDSRMNASSFVLDKPIGEIYVMKFEMTIAISQSKKLHKYRAPRVGKKKLCYANIATKYASLGAREEIFLSASNVVVAFELRKILDRVNYW
ncbi:CLUMA_CG014943, isoform A [Clunio marinus]|uniref:CLUMA_CG014943, isoform A n=1 Tax=Clunio marinus TaxID=568069 RepID=A0A1J1INB8_9DIPT|nr:CLUMA_CG014943, isoform A [Clunio marinus]